MAEVHAATQLVPVQMADEDFDKIEPQVLEDIGGKAAFGPVAYEPPYPANGSELDQVRWLAGKASIELMRTIEVISDPDFVSAMNGPPQPGEFRGYGFRFYDPPTEGEGFVATWLGYNVGEVHAFLRGMTFNYYRPA